MSDTTFADLLRNNLSHIGEWVDASMAIHNLIDHPDDFPIVAAHLDAKRMAQYTEVAKILDETPHEGAIALNDLCFAVAQVMAGLMVIRDGDYTPQELEATASYIVACITDSRG